MDYTVLTDGERAEIRKQLIHGAEADYYQLECGMKVLLEVMPDGTKKSMEVARLQADMDFLAAKIATMKDLDSADG